MADGSQELVTRRNRKGLFPQRENGAPMSAAGKTSTATPQPSE